eukprot:m.103822 g.103822  ORF g.103822 m.103822 type:complete len:298 (+) comp27519_c0_seq2:172-1065(+)
MFGWNFVSEGVQHHGLHHTADVLVLYEQESFDEPCEYDWAKSKQKLLELPPTDDTEVGIAVYSLVKAETQFIYWEIFKNRCYTHDGWIVVESDAVVFDVGANIGLFSLWATFENSVKIIHAFEPLPRQFDTLVANLTLHEIGDLVKPHQIALGARDEHVDFTYYPNMPGNSTRWPEEKETLQRDKMSDSKFEGAVQVSVHVRTLSDVFADERIARVNLLKVDVEGEELNVLLGLSPSDWRKIDQVVLEVHEVESRVAVVTTLLETHGFDVRVAHDDNMSSLCCYTVAAKRCGERQPT